MTSPARGEIVRQIGEALRHHKKNLGRLVRLSVHTSHQDHSSRWSQACIMLLVVSTCVVGVDLTRDG
jgi:hypothetical protein